MAYRVAPSTRRTGRIWSGVLGLVLTIVLVRGQVIDSTGFAPHERIVSASGDPLEFYSFVALLLAGFVISSFFGFIARVETDLDAHSGRVPTGNNSEK